MHLLDVAWQVLDPKSEQLSVHQGMLIQETGLIFEARHGGGIKVVGQKSVIATQVGSGLCMQPQLLCRLCTVAAVVVPTLTPQACLMLPPILNHK